MREVQSRLPIVALFKLLRPALFEYRTVQGHAPASDRCELPTPQAARWFLVAAVAVLSIGRTLVGSAPAASHWRQFRGTDNTGVAPSETVPVQLDAEENLAWRVDLPGRGPSSPIVVGRRVIVTASSGPRQDRLHVLCFAAHDGRLLWHRQIWATGSTIHNPFGAVANSTPASDGQRVFALFSSNDLVCFDLDGNLLWHRGFGYERPRLRNDVGMASSPLVIGNVVIAQMESESDAIVVGLDATSGQTRWQLPRKLGATWCSPTLLRPGPSSEAKQLVLLQTRGELAGHDPQTGRQLWRYEADCHTIASVAADDSRIYLPANGIHALRYDQQTNSIRLLWYERRLRGNNSSPVVYNGRIYRIKAPMILMCAEANTGRMLWQLRLKGSTWATPVVAGDYLYAVNQDGLVQVVYLGSQQQRDPTGRVEPARLVATVQLDPKMLASPAVADGAIYFRSDQHLWKFAARTTSR